MAERVLPVRLEFTGQFVPAHQVDVRPRVSGSIINAPINEGASIKAGDLLFEIDSRPFIAKHAEAQAEKARAKAVVVLAQHEFVRAERLSKEDAIAQEELERRSADLKAATAALEAAAAREAAASLDLEFTKVKAPISGRVGRALAKSGNLVTGGNANGTLLTTIVAVDPIHVLFNLDEPAYRLLTALRASGKPLPAEVRLSGEPEALLGKIDYLSNLLDARSGTGQARAVIENDHGRFSPGLFARVTVIAETDTPSLAIPETALGAEQGNRYVLVLDRENKLSYRRVALGEKQGEQRLIKEGLAAGETIVVNGLQKVRPGMTVRPVEPQFAQK